MDTKHFKNNRAPHIGLFWYTKSSLMTHSQELHSVMSNDAIVDLDIAHYEAWESVIKDKPMMQRYAYDEIARGRVVYDVAKRIFSVYADACLNQKSAFRQVIIDHFKLNKAITTFVDHDAYTFNQPDI